VSRPSYKTTSEADYPAPYPGCWQRRRWKLARMRVWKRLKMRNNPAYREASRQRGVKWRAVPKNRRRARKMSHAWNRAHKSYFRLRWRRESRKLCFFCHGPARCGNGGGMQRIERMLPSARGLELRTVNYCGKC